MAIFWALVSDKQTGAASAEGGWQSGGLSANAENRAKIEQKTDFSGLPGDAGEARAKYNIEKKIASRRYFVTENEARANLYNGEKIERIELDEIEARQAAANWLNHCESMRQRAIKREANKTAKQRSDNMKKAWITRKAKS